MTTPAPQMSDAKAHPKKVAKNFFLSRERTFTRKFNEIFLALQIEQSLTKNEILELYFNKIYLGNRAYGIQAAAQVYYDKSVAELTLAETAMIAGLPKAPSAYNPLANPERALIRRNWILDRMLDLNMISLARHAKTIEEPVTASYYTSSPELEAAYAAESARQEIIKRFGAAAYTEGYTAYLTIDSTLQRAANRALKKGLDDYDRRHGYRGPLSRISAPLLETEEPGQLTRHLRNIKHADHHVPALVLSASEEEATLLVNNGEEITLDHQAFEWAAPFINVNQLGKEPASPSDAVMRDRGPR